MIPAKKRAQPKPRPYIANPPLLLLLRPACLYRLRLILARVVVGIGGLLRGLNGGALELLHHQLDRFFELHVVALAPSLRRHFHLNIGSDTVVFHVPFALGVVEGEARRGDPAAIEQRRITANADQSTPGARAYQRPDMVEAEIPRRSEEHTSEL